MTPLTLKGFLPRIEIVHYPGSDAAHFMDTGLDPGGILRLDKVMVDPGDTIQRLRGKIEAWLPEILPGAMSDFGEGEIPC